jgi:hypothetical protein
MLDEFNFHLRSVDSTLQSANLRPGSKSTADYQREFIRYTIDNLLLSQSDSVFISNRWYLPKVKSTSCDSTTTIIKDTMSNGDELIIQINTGTFDNTKHVLKGNSENMKACCMESIDGQIPYGAGGIGPNTEIKSLSISLNGKAITIPKHAYQNLFDPNLFDQVHFERKIEAYTSRNSKYIYVYIYGGRAATNYFAKLIFDREKYVTRIVADYVSMMDFDCFSKWSILY